MSTKPGQLQFLNLLHRWESAELNQEEAAELLGVSERTFRRWTRRYEEEGEAGLGDRRLGKASGKRKRPGRGSGEALSRALYPGFTVKHFHEHLVKDHGFGWGYTGPSCTFSGWESSLGRRARARPFDKLRRRKRERRPLPGMMLHQDGSRQAWLEGAPPLDLIVTLDDAMGAIYSAFLVEEEGTASTFRALKEAFGVPGLPMSLYTDRGAHYFQTTRAGEIDRGHLTQVGRALKQLGVEHIGAYSPQARGRSERAFGTLQDRLVKELKLAAIVTIEAASAFIREVYLPAHNARFGLHADPGRRSRRDPNASRRSARLATTIACPTARSNCRSRRARCVRTSSRRESRSTSTPTARPLPRTPLHRPLRPERSDQGCEKRRLNPLGGALVEMWTMLPRRPQSQEAEQNQKKRTS